MLTTSSFRATAKRQRGSFSILSASSLLMLCLAVLPDSKLLDAEPDASAYPEYGDGQTAFITADAPTPREAMAGLALRAFGLMAEQLYPTTSTSDPAGRNLMHVSSTQTREGYPHPPYLLDALRLSTDSGHRSCIALTLTLLDWNHCARHYLKTWQSSPDGTEPAANSDIGNCSNAMCLLVYQALELGMPLFNSLDNRSPEAREVVASDTPARSSAISPAQGQRQHGPVMHTGGAQHLGNIQLHRVL